MHVRCSLVKGLVLILATVLLGLVQPLLAAAQDEKVHKKEQTPKATPKHKPANVRLAMPMMNAERGMYLFAAKGCVSCHAVNGAGGHDAKNLDAHTMDKVMNPFEFTAKMWRMAPAMIAAQEEVFGSHILFTGHEIADIIAFVHDDEQQHKFAETMIPSKIAKLMHHTHGKKPAHQKELGHRSGAMPRMDRDMPHMPRGTK